MGFDVGYGVRIHVGDGQCLGYHFRLSVNTRSEVAYFPCAVIVDRGAANYSVNEIAVVQSIFKTPEYDHTGSAAENRTTGVGVKRTAVTVAREHLTLTIYVAAAVGYFDRHATGQGHIAFVVQQALTGQMNRDQRRRTGCLYGKAGSCQAQLV